MCKFVQQKPAAASFNPRTDNRGRKFWDVSIGEAINAQTFVSLLGAEGMPWELGEEEAAKLF
jgi:hypothetical protein